MTQISPGCRTERSKPQRSPGRVKSLSRREQPTEPAAADGPAAQAEPQQAGAKEQAAVVLLEQVDRGQSRGGGSTGEGFCCCKRSLCTEPHSGATAEPARGGHAGAAAAALAAGRLRGSAVQGPVPAPLRWGDLGSRGAALPSLGGWVEEEQLPHCFLSWILCFSRFLPWKVLQVVTLSTAQFTYQEQRFLYSQGQTTPAGGTKDQRENCPVLLFRAAFCLIICLNLTNK